MQLVSNEGLLEKCLATIAAREKEIKALLTIVKPENEQMAGDSFCGFRQSLYTGN